MSTTEKPAEIVYQPGTIIALNIPQEPAQGTRLQDENGYICENVGPKEHCDKRACWVWEDKTGNILPPRMTWAEVLSDATSPLTVLPPKFKTGGMITRHDQLDQLPQDTVLLDDGRFACQKKMSGDWWLAGLKGEQSAHEIDLPATILWLREDEEQA